MLPIALSLASLAPITPTQDLLVETRRMLPDLAAFGLGALSEAAVGDVTGDGWPDIVVGGEAGDVLLVSAGHGLFDEVVELGTSSPLTTTVAIEIVDVDGDGAADLLLGKKDGTVGIYNQVAGTLLPGSPIASGLASLSDLAAGDTDLDGDVDLVLVSDWGDAVFENQGGAFVLDSGALAAPADGSRDAALVDVDADGDLDLGIATTDAFWTGPSLNRLFRNDGAGGLALDLGATLGADGQRLAFGDVDGDGDLDAAISSSSATTVYVQTPSSGFAPIPGFDGGAAWGSALVDLTDDGNVDLLTFGAETRLFEAQPATQSLVEVTDTNLPRALHVFDAAIADLDGDSDLDVLGVTGSGPPLLWLNDDGVFGAFETALPTADGAQWGHAVGDLTGDGAPDVYVASLEGNDIYLQNDGTGRWIDATASLPPGANGHQAAHMFDSDGDGDLDVVTGGGFVNTQLLQNDGAGALNDLVGALPASAWGPSDWRSGDFDGDGAPDLVLVRQGLVFEAVFFSNSGSATFDLAWTHIGEAGLAGAPELLDADLDGDLDVFVPNFSESTLLLGDGNLGFEDVSHTLPSDMTFTFAVGDVDGDGDMDVIAGRSESDELWLGNGAAGFQVAPGISGPTAATFDLVLADLDADGDLDLIRSGAEGNELLFNAGGTFSGAQPFSGGAVSDMQLADLDGDGDLDVIGSGGDRTVQLTQVGDGQIAQRTVARVGKPLAMEVFGNPGAPWFLAASPGIAEAPLMPFGTLLLDPSQLWLLGSGAVPAEGVARVEIPLALPPAFVGSIFHWQALVGTSLAFTNREATPVTSF